MSIKTLLIDDERLARLELRKLLKEHPSIEVIEEAANVEEALQKIDLLKPDLIFLDIQMPGKTGFDLLAELDRAPQVIFTTAHHEFALKAFQVNALDYLMKPVEPGRLADAIQKIQSMGGLRTSPQEAEVGNGGLLTENDQVFVKDGERCWFVKLSEIVQLKDNTLQLLRHPMDIVFLS